jgi:heterodisulfide reductase subunit A-like polyferredoxin
MPNASEAVQCKSFYIFNYGNSTKKAPNIQVINSFKRNYMIDLNSCLGLIREI